MMKPIFCIVLHFADLGSSNVLKRGIYDLPAIAQPPIVPTERREIVTVQPDLTFGLTDGFFPDATIEANARTVTMEMSHLTRFTVERLSLISDRSFESVLATIRQGIGHPEMHKFWEAIWGEGSFQKVESLVTAALGPTGLMQFGEFDDGGFIRKDRGEATPRAMRLLVGNPLIMKQMTELVPDAAAYAPVTILIDERGGKVHVSYDRMVSLLSPYNNPGATRIAQALDGKIETLIRSAL